jgi:2'-5' RNA ligase
MFARWKTDYDRDSAGRPGVRPKVEVVYGRSGEWKAMFPSPNGAERINSFAVVAYIPDPLGSFLDQLRRELEPSTLAPRAHVTVLPPRALREGVSVADAWAQLQRMLPAFHAFPLRMGHVEIFPTTNVVYISLNQGIPALQSMHEALNTGLLESVENFKYHPHVTLAQGLVPEQAMEIAARAQRRWNDFPGPRGFSAETLTFVQNTLNNKWVDIQGIVLPELAPSAR